MTRREAVSQSSSYALPLGRIQTTRQSGVFLQVEYNASAFFAMLECPEAGLNRARFGVIGGLFFCVALFAAARQSAPTFAPKPSSTASSQPASTHTKAQPKPTTTPAQTHLTPAVLSVAKSLGSSSAPIRIDEFSDFQCPTCRAFYQGTLRLVIDNYVSTGKVFIVHHDFPLHPHSRDAARWANAAAATGRFETVEQNLFAKQDDWGATGRIEPVIAAALSPAEMKKVQTIYQQDGPQLDAAVDTDVALGHAEDVRGTPSIFVTAHGSTQALPPGGVAYTYMKQYLDYLLTH
jgi:protein-disulfide isomerase